jgi:hypothetical protein
MNYQNEVLGKLEKSNCWPYFQKPETIQELHDLAGHIYSKETMEGYLASMLIYHQLIEEMTKILIECSTFFVQLSVFPSEFKARSLDRKMFGQLIEELNQGVVNNETLAYIKKCKDFNKTRIDMVHKLTLKTSLSIASQEIKGIKKCLMKSTICLIQFTTVIVLHLRTSRRIYAI